MRARTLPLDCWRKARNQRLLCVFWGERERENLPRNAPRNPFLKKKKKNYSRGLRGYL